MHFNRGVFALYLVLAGLVFLFVGPLAASVFHLRGSMTPLLVAIAAAGSVVLIGIWRALGALFHFSLGATLLAILTLQIPVLVLLKAKKNQQLQQVGLFLLIAWILALTIYLLDRAGVRMQSPQHIHPDFASGISIEWVENLTDEWKNVPEVRAGWSRKSPSDPRRHVLVRHAGHALLRIALYGNDEDSIHTEQSASWGNLLALGWGHRVSVIEVNTRHAREYPLGAPFVSMRQLEHGLGLLVASAERLFLINREGALEWQSDVLGVSRLEITEIADGFIFGQGEWDPPGGWKPFQVRLNSGHTVFAGKLD